MASAYSEEFREEKLKKEAKSTGYVSGEQNRIDVICQHNKDSSMVPIKLRLTDEDGERQTFQVRKYRDLTYYVSNEGGIKKARNDIWKFECHILVFTQERSIIISYNAKENIWYLVS